MLLIPAIDVRAGRCVRLYQGDFAAETRYAVEPGELLLRYQAHGASWLHLVDLDRARDGGGTNRALIERLAGLAALQLQVGGGIRAAQDIAQLLDAGVARAVVGSAAVECPGTVAAWLARFGRERICLAFDVRTETDGEPRVRTHGWTRASGLTLWEALGRLPPRSVRHVLCTDIERDGAMRGPNLALYAAALARFPQLAWQASGGVRDVADLAELAKTGVTAAVSGKALLEEMTFTGSEQSKNPAVSLPGLTSAHGDSRTASLASYLPAARSRS
jgi:phosphoribosylformimino-5-aminoimidazole carboxamide ribotide isomerase